eukprot:m51a1_g2107 hypothetical protein (757) ;mRNA; r:1614201-1616985
MARTPLVPVLAILVALASAKYIYVNPGKAVVPASGNESFPFATIQEALNKASDGDTIMLVGSFSESVTLNKSVSLQAAAKNTLNKVQMRGTLTFKTTVKYNNVNFTNIQWLVSGTKAVDMGTAALNGVAFVDCVFALKAGTIGPVVGGEPAISGKGLRFEKCVFDNRATVSSGDFVKIATNSTASPGRLAFSQCIFKGANTSSPTGSCAVRVNTNSGLDIVGCQTMGGGVFILQIPAADRGVDGGAFIQGNTFTGLGVELNTAVDVEVLNNKFQDFGTLIYGTVEEPRYTLTEGYAAIYVDNAHSVIDAKAWNDVTFLHNNFGAIGHSEFAMRVYSDTILRDQSAQLNFWGDISGPFSTGCNPDGRGPRISNNFLANEYCMDNTCEKTVITKTCNSQLPRFKNGEIITSVIVSVFGFLLLIGILWVALFVYGKTDDEALKKAEPEEDPGIPADETIIGAYVYRSAGMAATKPIYAAAPAPVKPMPAPIAPVAQPEKPAPAPAPVVVPIKPVVEAAPAPEPRQPEASKALPSLMVKPPPEQQPQKEVSKESLPEPREPNIGGKPQDSGSGSSYTGSGSESGTSHSTSSSSASSAKRVAVPSERPVEAIEPAPAAVAVAAAAAAAPAPAAKSPAQPEAKHDSASGSHSESHSESASERHGDRLEEPLGVGQWLGVALGLGIRVWFAFALAFGICFWLALALGVWVALEVGNGHWLGVPLALGVAQRVCEQVWLGEQERVWSGSRSGSGSGSHSGSGHK